MSTASLLFTALLGALALACGPRLYEGMPDHVRKRHVVLEGAHNFRDLGGYATEDGRRVRWGLFYRSDALSELSDADLDKLRALGIKLVCDFRSAEEKAEAPDRLPPARRPSGSSCRSWTRASRPSPSARRSSRASSATRICARS